MSNNLTAPAKSGDWNATQLKYTGRRTALTRGFFMSAARLYLRFMVGGAVKEPSFDGSALRVADSGISTTAFSATQYSKIPLRRGGPEINTRRLTMAQLRLLVDTRLSEYGKRVRYTIQRSIPKIGDSPRILLDPNEISALSHISVDNVMLGIKDLEREGYIARMFKGRRSKANVYALLNPELTGSAMEVWQ